LGIPPGPIIYKCGGVEETTKHQLNYALFGLLQQKCTIKDMYRYNNTAEETVEFIKDHVQRTIFIISSSSGSSSTAQYS